MSGLACLILSNKKIDSVEQYYREVLRKLMRLYKKTPRSVIYFLAGSLPGSALLHIRQLSLFGMICRLKNSILHHHALNFFSFTTVCRRSWFDQIRRWCLMYGLPHPSSLLSLPPDRLAYKKLIKSKVTDYWEQVLRAESESLKSLAFFNTNFLSLSSISPLLCSAGHSPFEVVKALVQMWMVSGRYGCGSLLRHWSNQNDGLCQLSPNCNNLENVSHILQRCVALSPTRQKLLQFTRRYCLKLPRDLQDLILMNFELSNPRLCNFLLESYSQPEVIHLAQELGNDVYHHCLHISCTWVYALHRERLKFLGTWRRPPHI